MKLEKQVDPDKEFGFYLEGLTNEGYSAEKLHEQFCILRYWFGGK